MLTESVNLIMVGKAVVFHKSQRSHFATAISSSTNLTVLIAVSS